jgi:hypothetical protein
MTSSLGNFSGDFAEIKKMNIEDGKMAWAVRKIPKACKSKVDCEVLCQSFISKFGINFDYAFNPGE